MLQFISYGSGSSGNCYELCTDDDALLIDAGVGVRSLKKFARDFGMNLAKVRQLLVTHDHADHIKCVGSLSHDMHLPVYATRTVHNGVDRNYCVTHKVDSDLRQYIEPGKTITLGSFTVTPFSVPHDSSDNVGYMIECQGVAFCIITDAGEVTETMSKFIARANYLVIEANHDVEMLMNGPYPPHLKKRIQSTTGHLSNTSCAEAIASYAGEQLRHVWLCHLSQENNHPELARKTVETILRSYGIIAGKDLQLDVLKRTTPTGPFNLLPGGRGRAEQLTLFPNTD